MADSANAVVMVSTMSNPPRFLVKADLCTVGTSLNNSSEGVIVMIKVKQFLISLAVFWLVCYAAMFLLIWTIFPPSSSVANHSNQQLVNPANAVAMVSGSINALASAPAVGQSGPADLFTRPFLPASLMTIFAGLALACGYHIIRIYGNFLYRN
jgi:hypothetical protein